MNERNGSICVTSLHGREHHDFVVRKYLRERHAQSCKYVQGNVTHSCIAT